MSVQADASGHLSEARICELTGTSQQRRQTWVSRGLLVKASEGGCSLDDALALAQLLRLVTAFGPTDGVAAWQQTRDELDQSELGADVHVLFDLELKKAIVIQDLGRVGERVVEGRPFKLARLGPRRAEVADAFRRLCAAVDASE